MEASTLLQCSIKINSITNRWTRTSFLENTIYIFYIYFEIFFVRTKSIFRNENHHFLIYSIPSTLQQIIGFKNPVKLIKNNVYVWCYTVENETRCYDELGCLNITRSWYHLIHRPLNVFPLPREVINTRFILYTNENPTEVSIHLPYPL